MSWQTGRNSHGLSGCSDAGPSDSSDVRGEEVDAVSVEVSAGAVVVLGRARVSVARQDLRVAQRDAGVESVGDGGVTQRVRADVARNASDLGDSHNHPVDVSAVDRLPGGRSQDERPDGSLFSAGLRTRSTGIVIGMVAGLLPFPTRCRTRCPRSVSA